MPTKQPTRARFTWAVPATIIVLAGLLILIVIGIGSGNPEADPAQATSSAEIDLTTVELRNEADLMAAGPVDAPVGLVIFSDYQCPYCAQWNEETLPLMMAHAESGDLRIEWRDVNVFGADSARASRASYAAALQGKFWEYHNALFPDGHTLNETGLSNEALISLATELGLDAEQFTADLNSESTYEQINTNQQLGLSLGAYSTPAFILGGQPIMGAQPSGVFEQTLQAALANTK